VRMATAGLDQHTHTVIAGLGGRAITRASLRDMLCQAARDELGALTFLDLNTALVRRELDRAAAARRSGPAAENMLRDLGAVASRIG
jgi:pyruvate ferredoxin oxidoreductase alpha subunit